MTLLGQKETAKLPARPPAFFALPGNAFAFAVALAVAAWLALLLQGLPVADMDDWDRLLMAHDIAWGPLLKSFFRPWSTSIHWTGQVDRYNELYSKRVFLTVVQKAIEQFWGMQSFPHYFLKSLFFAGTSTLFFVFLRRVTRSLPFALGGTFFFVLVPAHYPHLMWLMDAITLVHCLIMAALVFAFPILKSFDRRDPAWKPFLARLAAFAALGFAAMKTKEPALSLPLALGLYTVLRLFDWKDQKGKLALWLAVLAFLIFLDVPVLHLFDAGQQHFHFRPERVLRFLWRNYGCGYQDETSPALFSLQYVWPVSVARTFGFAFLWLLIFSGAAAFLRRGKIAAEKPGLPVLFFACWALGEIPFMIFFEPDPRYFSGMMIPLTVLAVLLFQKAWQGMAPGAPRKIFAAVLCAALAWTLVLDLKSILWLRLQIGQRVHRLYHTADTIYRDRYPDIPFRLRDLALYYCSDYVLNHPRLEQDTFFVGMGYEDWNRLGPNAGTIEDFERFAKQGYVYYANDIPDPFRGDPRVKELAALSGVNEGSALERLIYAVKKKPAPFFIYKWVGA
ncbi:MAG TPA: hypothetical protein VL688_12125 [Verrucomicrobiae bacterium]|nr:hypothetical protein [Verrucomicrobiae bacterium]